MKIYSILSHPNQHSLNARMFDLANKHFCRLGHEVDTLDLYRSIEQLSDSANIMYQDVSLVERKYMSPYSYNYATNSEKNQLGKFAKIEIDKLKNSDVLYIQSPILVWSLPAILKLYIENIFVINELFLLHNPWSDDNFKIDRYMEGKQVMFSLTMGSSQSLTNEVIGNKDLLIHPIKSIFNFVGYEWIDPHITWGTTEINDKRQDYLDSFQQYLNKLFY